VARRIEQVTGLKARTQREFALDSIGYVAANTGIPINFGLTGDPRLRGRHRDRRADFSLFIRDNIKQFGALKAIGVTNGKIRGMVALQAGWIGFIGYGIGIGLASAVHLFRRARIPTRSRASTRPGRCWSAWRRVLLMVFATGFLALRKVLKTEPAEVFR
jgi:putative ABC transport system permease protein